MSKIIVTDDATQETEQIIKAVESHLDLKKNEDEIRVTVQKILQAAFEEGRKFQKQLMANSSVKDSVMAKADI